MSQVPIRSDQANQIICRREHDKLVITAWPGWLTAGSPSPVSVPFSLPEKELQYHALAPILVTANLLLQSKRTLRHYVIPIETSDRETEYLLLSSEFNYASGRTDLILHCEDVTEVILQRRRSAYVGTYHGIIGRSYPMLNVFHRISMYGPTDAPVIITGETGTGKELIARALHDTSKRASKPFVPVNCTALSPELFESELFGHEKGSFTGAYREHKGRFERAHEGTLFLDEIGDMPQITQAKLLRALEEGVIERVGAEREYQVDVRVIAATNVGLEQAVAENRFRSDLFHRLSVLRIHLPALRERVEDIPLIINYFLDKFNDRYGKNIKRVTPEGVRKLQSYYWPGNIRELRNVIERLVVETMGDAIGVRAVEAWEAERDYFMPGGWNADVTQHHHQPSIIVSDKQTQNQPPQQYHAPQLGTGQETKNEKPEITRDLLIQYFQETDGNLTEVARRLGVHKATLYRQMKNLSITREDLEAEVSS